MKWQEAVRFSRSGAAERTIHASHREPHLVHAWFSKKNRFCLVMRNGRGKVICAKGGARYEDWRPVNPHPPLKVLAIAVEIEDDLENGVHLGHSRNALARAGAPRNRRRRPRRRPD